MGMGVLVQGAFPACIGTGIWASDCKQGVHQVKSQKVSLKGRAIPNKEFTRWRAKRSTWKGEPLSFQPRSPPLQSSHSDRERSTPFQVATNMEFQSSNNFFRNKCGCGLRNLTTYMEVCLTDIFLMFRTLWNSWWGKITHCCVPNNLKCHEFVVVRGQKSFPSPHFFPSRIVPLLSLFWLLLTILLGDMIFCFPHFTHGQHKCNPKHFQKGQHLLINIPVVVQQHFPQPQPPRANLV